MSAPARPLLDVRNLSVSFSGLRGATRVLDDLSFSIERGEIVGLVGESGSGKSVTSLAIMGLLGAQGRVDRGSIRLGEHLMTGITPEALPRIRGRDVAMIFQEPTTSLNPIFTAGYQIAEVLMRHFELSSREAMTQAVAMMERVGIPAAAQRARSYPHELSGGLKQRVMIAMALACNPGLLIADEPTTALDVTTQAQILDLIRELRDELGMAVLLITHDMGVIAELADRVLVMYAGQIVEQAPADELFSAPAQPYTRLLLRAIPSVRSKPAALPVIEGNAPSAGRIPPGCRFHPRCPMAREVCREGTPPLEQIAPRRHARCKRLDAVAHELPGLPEGRAVHD